MPIKYSKHAREQMIARGISEREVADAVKRGSKALQRPNKVLSYYRYLCVVYKQAGSDTYIITVKPR